MRTTTVDDTISRTIEALMHYRGVSRDQLCDAAHLSTSSYYNRIRGARSWTAAEVAAVAELLGVGVGVLYDGLDLGGGGANPMGIRSLVNPETVRLTVGCSARLSYAGSVSPIVTDADLAEIEAYANGASCIPPV